ncbi:hypothetical protein RJ639_019473 [Escallonia herrerae]|uniref:histone deacetylase n=1 Tax=Escallonia herrerae TaxID=1293975 RepID=A0AA88V8T6_9ASTE|nr:hypothetical protein RJ639_019473 [Escallonia herrerae]
MASTVSSAARSSIVIASTLTRRSQFLHHHGYTRSSVSLLSHAMSSASSSSPVSSLSDVESLRRSRILSSKLYFDVPPSKVPLIYSSSYDIAFLGMENLRKQIQRNETDASQYCQDSVPQTIQNSIEATCDTHTEPIHLNLPISESSQFESSMSDLDKPIAHRKAEIAWSCHKRHPFDSSKWGRVCRFLILDGVLEKNRIVEPLEATENDLLVVNSESYLNSLKSSLNVSIIVEIPPVALLPNCLVQKKILYPFRKQVGGTILAAKLAKERGWAINVGGGFHHCCAQKGGGFCAYADISLCIHYSFTLLNISRVMIIDLDAHQGNGHEQDFSNDRRVYILDMYNPGIYPFDHEARRSIDQKVEVVSGTTTDDYLAKLDEALQVAEHTFDPELVVYNAGTDVLDGDPLGRLKISPEGVTSRDEKVFRFARERNIPLVMLTSGGYMKSSARVIADSIMNLSKKRLIDMEGSSGKI